MEKIISSEGADTLITSHFRQGQLPWQVEKAISIAPEGEMRDMLLLSLLTNYAYALPAMRMYHGFPHHVYGPELMTMVLAPAASGKGIETNYWRDSFIKEKFPLAQQSHSHSKLQL